MKQPAALITEYDMGRLRFLINRGEKDNYPELRMRLAEAKVVPGQSIPPDIVTVNSKVLVRDVSTGNDRDVRVVFPKDEDSRSGRISVAQPLGAALLGSRKGDEVMLELAFLKAEFRVKVMDITYQPEQHGRFTAK